MDDAQKAALKVTEKQLLSIFRENLAAVRNELGISQSELARRVGKFPAYISDLERGRRSPNLTTLANLADGLGVTPSVLISAALNKQAKK